MNERIRALLEEARSLAAALPQFEGMETVKKLNELLGLRPIRSDTPRAHLRALPTWGRDPEAA